MDYSGKTLVTKLPVTGAGTTAGAGMLYDNTWLIIAGVVLVLFVLACSASMTGFRFVNLVRNERKLERQEEVSPNSSLLDKR